MANRIKSGITGFDLLLGGGIPAGHSVMLQSPIPLENSIFTYQFIKKGLENYEPVLVVLSKISPQKFREYLKVIGVDAREYEKNGYLKIVDWYSFKSGKIVGDVEDRDGVICASKDLTNIGIAINRGIKALVDAPVKRAVLDVLSQALNFFEYKRVYNFAQGMVARLRDNNITSIFTIEIHADETKTLSALHGIFDGVIDVKLLREGDKLIRKIGILSMSGIKFDPKYRDFWIEDNEMIIGDWKEIPKPPDKDRIPKPTPPLPSKPPKKLPTEIEEYLKEKIELVRDHPQNPDTWFSLGSTLLSYERNEDSLLAFDKVIELNPHHMEVWEAKAKALKALGRDEEAEECLKRSREIITEEAEEEKEPPPLEDLERELMGILEEGEKPPPKETELEKVEFECPKCGTALGEDDTQCPNCGTRFDELEEIPDELLVKAEEEVIEEIPKPEAPLEELEEEAVEEIPLPTLETALEELEKEVLEEISKPQLETALEELEEELGKFVGEELEPEKDIQVSKVLECPECGTYVEAEATSCPICGARFVEISEVTEPPTEITPEIELEEELEPEKEIQVPMVLECPECGTYVEAEATSCPSCGAQFVEISEVTEPTEEVQPEIEMEDELERFVREQMEPEVGLEKEIEEYECPMCGGQVVSDDTMCPHCGIKFGAPEVGLETKLREEEFEPSELPGLTNGLTNGLRRGVRGVTNGLTNGITNGLTNGLRALRSGITNGVTNGNGITNGIAPYHKVMDKKRGTIRVVATITFFLLLLLSPFLLRVVVEQDNIIIDGSFEDWSGVVTNTFDAIGPPFPPNIDIVEYRVDDRQFELSFYLRVEGDMLAGEPDMPGGEKQVDTVHIFIDTDKTPDTGYYINYIGADYMIRIYGWNGEILSSGLHSYTSNEQDWNHWEQVGSVSSAIYGSELEGKVSYNAIYLKNDVKVDVLFHMQSWDGFEDFSDTVISNDEGVLLVNQQGVGEGYIIGNGNRLLKLELKALNVDLSLDELNAKRTGVGNDSDVAAIRLEDETGDSIATGTMSNGVAIFKPKLLLNEGEDNVFYFVVDISESAISGNTIGLRIINNSGVMTDKGTVSLKRVKPEGQQYDNSYIINVPENVTIDGAFVDWEGKTVRNDTDGDVNRADLDILKYGVSTTEEGTAFYLKVDGEMCGGIKVPYRNRETKAEPIEPGEPGPPSPPAPPAPLPPPKTGEDFVYIFIDTIEGTGYIGDLPIDADFMIEVKGRYNQVLSKTYYEWSGTFPMEWNWEEQGSVDVGLDSIQMEIGIKWEDIGIDPLNDRFDVFFLTTDWEEGEKDYSDTEGAIEGPTRAYIGDGKSRGYDVKYHGDYDVYFEEISGEVLFETKDGFYLGWKMPQYLKIESESGIISILSEQQYSDFWIDESGANYGYTYGDYDISARYQFGENVLKEDIVLGEKLPGDIGSDTDGTAYLLLTMPMSYSPELRIYVDEKEQLSGFVTTSNIEFRNHADNVPVYTLRSPIAIDAEGYEMVCEYIIEFGSVENAVSLGLRCSYDWLSSATFPVRIDPTVLENDFYTFNEHDTGERLGYSVAVGDFDGDGTEDDVIAGAYYWGNVTAGFSRWGAAYVFYGPITDNEYTPDAIINLTNEPDRDNSDYLGRCVAAADFDGDGVRDDVVLTTSDGAYVVYEENGISGVVTDADVTITAPSPSFWGRALTVGNFDGNLGDDIAISDYGAANVYLYFYDSSDWDDNGVVDNPPDITLHYGYTFGWAIAAGNLKDNGATDYDDIAVGAISHNSSEGAVLVFYGDGDYSDGPLTDYGNADVLINSGANYPIDNDMEEEFGTSIAIGDVNKASTTNDYEDLLIGAPFYGDNDEGRAYVFLTQDTVTGGFGSPTGEVNDSILQEGGTERFGWSVATGDFWNDGTNDALVGAPYTGVTGRDGYAYVYNFVTSLDNTSDWSLAGSSGERLGTSVCAGDVNNSGYDNIIAGCPRFDDQDPLNTNAGRVMVDEYIAEFQDVIFPTSIMITIFVFYRKRSTRKKRN